MHNIKIGDAHLEVGGDGAAADVDELRHVIVGVKSPDAALEVEVLVQLDALGLTHVGVELVRSVITGSQGDAVVGHVVQETRLCGCQSSPSAEITAVRELKYIVVGNIGK